MPDHTKEIKFVDPASSGNAEPNGPKLQALIDSIGTARREDVQTDVLWSVNPTIEYMTPQ